MADHYRALTRKYRPVTFDDIVSQEHVSSTLKNAIESNRLSHAYLFSGPRGVGKTTMARVLARTINNIDRDIESENLNQTLNVVEIDAASNNKVEDVHHLRESVRIPPQNGRYKVFIVDEVHMLSKQAFNALLKTLEEPPDHAIFIFATTEPHKVLPTILSRVQRFDFKRIQVEEMVQRLRTIADDEDVKIDDESLHVIAKKADGALRDALGLMDQAIAFCGTDINHEELLRALNVVSTERMFQFMEAVEKQDADHGLGLINELMEEGYDIQEFLIGLTEHLRNLYIARSAKQIQLLEVTQETRKRYRESAQTFTHDDMMRMLHIVSEAQYKIREAHQPRIQFEVTLLKLIHMKKTEQLSTLIGELKELKKKLNDQPLSSLTVDSDAKSESQETTSGEQQPAEPSTTASEDPEPQPAAEHASQPTPTAESDTKPETKPTPSESGNAVTDQTSERKGQDKPQDESGTNQPEKRTAAGEENTSATTQSQPSETPPATNGKVTSNGVSDGLDFFGKPSLNKISTAPKADQLNVQGGVPGAEQVAEPEPVADEEEDKNLLLHDVKELWPAYLTKLQSQVPQMLYLQMQRVDPIDLQHKVLTLRVNDAFAQKMIEENKVMLSRTLKQVAGSHLRLKCSVQKSKKSSSETLSPYERFKRLQERDPKIKTIVELFGAELEY